MNPFGTEFCKFPLKGLIVQKTQIATPGRYNSPMTLIDENSRPNDPSNGFHF